MAQTWRNWAGDQRCRPATIEHPASVGEVAAAVERSAAAGRTVRVAGAGHSFSEAVLTDGTLLSLRDLAGVDDVDRASGLARVRAGTTLRALNDALWEHGLAFENLGDIDAQSIAGATATGTHGTGGRLPNLSAALESIELVAADGTTVELDRDSDPDAWRAARVSLGALGVVTAVTLRAVPAFVLEGVDRAMALDDVLDGLDDLVAGADHFEFFTFPHSPLALTRTNRRVDRAPQPRSRARAWFEDIAMRNAAFELCCRVGRRRPGLIPAINRAVSRAGASGHRIDRSYRVFASPRMVRFTEMEYAIPREHAVEAVRAVREIADHGGHAVPFPLEVRFVAGDDALLSPAHGRDTCYIAAHMYRGMPHEAYFAECEALLAGLGGRPHWGKRHTRAAADLRDAYPEWDRFAGVRARLDPGGRFANGYVERVLGPVGARAAARS